MSDNWGADHIPLPRGVRPRGETIVEALASAQDMPLDALEAAIMQPEAITDPVLALLTAAAAGDELDQASRNLLFWGLHVLAQARETRVAAPLLALMRRTDEAALQLTGELAMGVLPKILVGTFDDDADALEAALADVRADEFFRWVMFTAYAFLVFDGRIALERAHAFLVRFDDERLARAGDLAWAGWEEAVGLLGLIDLVERRDIAVADARLLSTHETAEDFAAAVAMSSKSFDNPARFVDRGIGYVDDAIADLEEALDEEEEGEPDAPVHNPLRHVGRNDPCPCGSGKKYKKCCLAAA